MHQVNTCINKRKTECSGKCKRSIEEFSFQTTGQSYACFLQSRVSAIPSWLKSDNKQPSRRPSPAPLPTRATLASPQFNVHPTCSRPAPCRRQGGQVPGKCIGKLLALMSSAVIIIDGC